jgi:anthranilate phosphoribosyltransferase
MTCDVVAHVSSTMAALDVLLLQSLEGRISFSITKSTKVCTLKAGLANRFVLQLTNCFIGS